MHAANARSASRSGCKLTGIERPAAMKYDVACPHEAQRSQALAARAKSPIRCREHPHVCCTHSFELVDSASGAYERDRRLRAARSAIEHVLQRKRAPLGPQ